MRPENPGTSPAIRFEHEGDEAAIAAVHRAAFGGTDEADIVARVRAGGHARLSLVALLEKRLVGHVLFTPVTVRADSTSTAALALGPIGVLPVFQRRGIGSALVRAGLEACRRATQPVVFVLGDPAYYGRFGFRPAPPLGLRYGGAGLDPYFMVAELAPGALAGLRGRVEYLPAFE